MHVVGHEQERVELYAEVVLGYESVAAHFKALEAAGYGELDCVWRNWMWAVVAARLPVVPAPAA